jgi:hypothetical protein
MILLFIIVIAHDCIAILSTYLCGINQLQRAFIIYIYYYDDISRIFIMDRALTVIPGRPLHL